MCRSLVVQHTHAFPLLPSTNVVYDNLDTERAKGKRAERKEERVWCKQLIRSKE